MIVLFDNASLLPDAWRASASPDALRIFNPALLRDGDGWLFAYRVVAGPELRRRIALCRLTTEFRVVSGSQTPLSDFVRLARPDACAPEAAVWFADPRLYRFGGRLFLYWNSGWHEPQNHQFLQEIEPRTLRPIGAPRELTLRGPRRKLEKNWMLFDPTPPAAAGSTNVERVHAVYSVNPHRILAASLAGAGPIEFADAAPAVPNPGGYAQVHGGLRGGAPPQRLGAHFYSFCHSIENGADGYRYVPAVYRFAAEPPFTPADMPRRPLQFDLPAGARRALPKLNPAVDDVVYPAGAAQADGRWFVSIGVDDEHCAIVTLDHRDVIATLKPE